MTFVIVLMVAPFTCLYAQTPSIPGIPEMAAFHALAPQLQAGLEAENTQAVQQVLAELHPINRELVRGLTDALHRVQAAPPGDVFPSGSRQDAVILNGLVADGNRSRIECLYHVGVWTRTGYPYVYAPALEHLAAARTVDAELASKMSAALGNLSGITVPADLYVRTETDPALIGGGTYAIRVRVHNVGDVDAQNVWLTFSRATNLEGGDSEVHLGTIAGQTEKLHLFLVTAPRDSEMTAVKITARGDNIFPTILLEPLMVYTNAP